VDKRELTEVLRDLDKKLSLPCDVVLVGGAAMILYFGARRATSDVDALVLRGDVGALRRAVKEVAQEHKLPDNWMSDAVKGFADILPHDFYHRLVPLDLPFERLRLYVLGLPEQVAMKIVALREQDVEDLELLLRGMTEADSHGVVAIMNRLARLRPDWAQKIRYFVLEQGWKIQ